jgi:hypothetical protein
VAELERELRDLAVDIAFPQTPDVASAVRRRLGDRSRSTWPRRLVPIGVAAAALAVGVTFAVPQGRTAILRFFGIGAVRIELVDRLPDVRPLGQLDLGTRIDPSDAPFPLLRSTLLGEPDAAYRRGNVVTLLYGTPQRVRLLVTEIAGSGFSPTVGKKLLAAGTRVEFVPVEGATGPALWIEGQLHVVRLPGGRPRLAANTLIWKRGEITLRLEGAVQLQRAVAIAESLR